MTNWEYFTVLFKYKELTTFRDSLSGYGESGWELISLTGIQTIEFNFKGSGSETSEMVGVFKRPKEQVHE